VEWVRDRLQKKSRLVCAPGEGSENIQQLSDEGTLEVFALSLKRQFPLEDCMKLSQGWWPIDIKDPLSPLVAPTPENMKDVGGWFCEGMKSLADMLMTNTTQRTDIHIPETPKESFVKDGAMRWGFSGRAHYGWIQKRIEEWVKASAYIACPIKAWSSLEAQGEQENKKPVRGPEVIGVAATAQCPAWFNRMLHFSFSTRTQEIADPLDKTKKVQIQVAHRLMFLQPHIEDNDPYKIECLADARVPLVYADKVPIAMKPDVYELYDLLADLARTAKQTSTVGAGTTK
jgi:hypothetical protein